MSKSPLRLVSPDIIPRKEISPFQRGVITGAIEAGGKPAEIATRFGTPKATVRTIHKTALLETKDSSRPQASRPKTYSGREERRKLRYVRLNPKATYKKIKEDVGTTLSHDTILQLLKTHGIAPALQTKATSSAQKK